MDVLALIALAVMAVGLAGTVIPGLPGVLLVFGAAAVYALVNRFQEFGIGWLLLMGAIAAAATAVDIVAQPAVARRFGASGWGVLGALVGLVAGLLIGGPVGMLIGPLVGAVGAELLFGRTLRQALKSGAGTVVGFLLAFVVDAGAALTIMALFIALVLV
jgi:uncharacterized protein YqgC (DUF456 family)